MVSKKAVYFDEFNFFLLHVFVMLIYELSLNRGCNNNNVKL